MFKGGTGVIITCQKGIKHDIIELEMVGNEIKGQPRKLKEKPVLLGVYGDTKRTCEVMAETWCLNLNDKLASFVMPLN